MEKKLIKKYPFSKKLANLSLIGGNYKLSKNTEVNLNIYLNKKYQTAGSSSTEAPLGWLKWSQDWVSYFDQGRTGVDVSKLQTFTRELSERVGTINTQVRQLNPNQIRDFIATIEQLNNGVQGIANNNQQINNIIERIQISITTINEGFEAYKDELQRQVDVFIEQHDLNYEQFTRENREAIRQATNPIQEEVAIINQQIDLDNTGSQYSRKFAEYDTKQRELEEQIREKQELINGLTTNLEELTKQVQRNTTVIKQNYDQQKALSKRIRNTNVRTGLLEKRLKDQYDSLEGRINDEKSELEAELRRQNQANEEKIGRINEAISSIDQQIGAETQARKRELEEQKTQLEGKLSQLKDSHTQLELSINQQLTSLNAKIDTETIRATLAEKKDIQKRATVSKIRKKQNVELTKRLQKSEQKSAQTKRYLTSSINELTSTVETIEAKFESQSVINQHMVDVLRKLNSENLENQEKLRKIKKTPFGAFI